MVLPHHDRNLFCLKAKVFFLHDFTLIASVVGKSVIGHSIGGINFPDKMARLAKCKIAGVSNDRPSGSPDLEASQIRRRTLLRAQWQVKRYQPTRAYMTLNFHSSILSSRKSLLNSHNFSIEIYHPSTSSFLFPRS